MGVGRGRGPQGTKPSLSIPLLFSEGSTGHPRGAWTGVHCPFGVPDFSVLLCYLPEASISFPEPAIAMEPFFAK